MVRETEKIAFVGTLSSGKTTVFDKLQKRFQDDSRVVFIGEVARPYLTRRFEEHPEDRKKVHTIEIQGVLQGIIWQYEKDAHMQHPALIVCDRSVLDSVIHLEAAGDTKSAGILFQRVESYVPSYDHLFLLDPANVPYEQDEVRTETPEERMLIHNTFVRFSASTASRIMY
jgi:nicotinamide riboside kinase